MGSVALEHFHFQGKVEDNKYISPYEEDERFGCVGR